MSKWIVAQHRMKKSLKSRQEEGEISLLPMVSEDCSSLGEIEEVREGEPSSIPQSQSPSPEAEVNPSSSSQKSSEISQMREELELLRKELKYNRTSEEVVFTSELPPLNVENENSIRKYESGARAMLSRGLGNKIRRNTCSQEMSHMIT